MKNPHCHVFLGAQHDENERRTWWVVGFCAATMAAEMVGGAIFGSIALIADGLHMATHVGALLLAALAYRFARRHLADPRFAFGTGKFGDLAGFSSAIVLALIAALIAWDAVARLVQPVAIEFRAAIPIAALGLVVNIVSVALLGGAHDHAHAHDHGQEGAPGGAEGRDNNMRAARAHILADISVSLLVILGLSGAKFLGWVWLDPVMALIGAGVIVSWSWTLLRATGAVLLDMAPDDQVAERIRRSLEQDGARILDLHVWRVGPGHLSAVVSVAACAPHGLADYRARLAEVEGLSHLTIEIAPLPA